MDIGAIRTDYQMMSLSESEVLDDPIKQFEKWFEEALKAEVLEVNAFSLATSVNDFPDVRIVLLKGISNGELQFFTNYDSEKGSQISHNNKVAVTFFWPELQRQVRIRGEVSKLSTKDSDQYYFSRPEGSQIGAHVSQQSKPIENRGLLEERNEKTKQYFSEHPIERPSNWGGYGIKPKEVEFWQGRSSRLHDRILYKKEGAIWKLVRLQP